MNRRLQFTVMIGAVLGFLYGVPASAHVGGHTDSFWAGLGHPAAGLDHLLAMFTVGLLATQIPRLSGRSAWLVPGAFVASMVMGGALGVAGVEFPFIEVAIACSVVAFGLALVAGAELRPDVAIGLVAAGGFAHGVAHGAEAPTTGHLAAYIGGFVLTTVALHVSGVALGRWVRSVAVRRTVGALVVGAGSALVVGVI